VLSIFKPDESETIRIDAPSLRKLVAAIFERCGVPEDDAALGADVLVTADLRGVDSHGVSNMLRNYVAGYNRGAINPRPNIKVVQERRATATIDCDLGLGVMVAPKAMAMAIAKAKETGIGTVTMRNGNHLGMASYHAMLALEHDMVGMCMTAVGASMLPTFGSEPRLGTNPIAIAAPAGEMHPFVLDIATTVVAGNKLGLVRRLGATIPGNWIADGRGSIISEPGLLPAEYKLLPIGGTREMGSHKGYGLAMVVEIMCSLLAGAEPAGIGDRGRYNHMVAAYDIDAFSSVPEFKARMDQWLRTMEATPPAPGHERVLTPGQLEAEAEVERGAKGIPLHVEVVEWLRGVAQEYAIPVAL
jgi:L-2-hydroxycarboxylate dehydrogenase (NAD+)